MFLSLIHIFHCGNVDELSEKLGKIIETPLQHVDYDMSKYDWDQIADDKEEKLATVVPKSCLLYTSMFGGNRRYGRGSLQAFLYSCQQMLFFLRFHVFHQIRNL